MRKLFAYCMAAICWEIAGYYRTKASRCYNPEYYEYYRRQQRPWDERWVEWRVWGGLFQ